MRPFPDSPRLAQGLAALGLVLLAGTWACFPPSAAVTLRDTTAATGASPRPTATPWTDPSVRPSAPATTPSAIVAATSPMPAASLAPAPPSLAPAVGRRYQYATTGGAAPVLRDYEVTALAGDTATYRLQLVGANPLAEPVVTTVTRTFGVFWPEASPNPVTQDIQSYPAESQTVGAGTFACQKVEVAGGTTAWFSQGVVVKLVTPTATTTLLEVR